ncbi:hypothetical protein RhiirA1_479318 [Rhizophagus irregularis]|uniref:HTH LytTR-type domain-containing protein n=1 Tax=Rhizophagus irregularis TaxID=588596 RepID=A0A2N0QQV4_9GLOM|nr:hypothetical protein RhiirA1_479318 [Rhizophagus irregularis]
MEGIGRMQLVMKNETTAHVSRNYLKGLKKRLGDSTLSLTGEELLLQLSLALILGIACGLVSLIFTVETLPYLAKLAIHYVVTLLVVLICGSFGDCWDLFNGPKAIESNK